MCVTNLMLSSQMEKPQQKNVEVNCTTVLETCDKYVNIFKLFSTSTVMGQSYMECLKLTSQSVSLPIVIQKSILF